MRKGNRPLPGPEKSAVEWLNPTRFAILLTVALVASFPGVVLGLSAFACGDAGQFAYPVAFYHRQSFWRGEMPLWNPLNSCGIPFTAQWNTMTLYPLSLFYLLFPMPWSFDFFCLGHLFLAGMGMYFLAGRWTGNRAGAALAGLAFAFNGLTWYGVMWPHLLTALGWMPWVMLAMERAWTEGGRFVIFAALAAGMQLLTGGAEVILQTWLVVGVFWVAAFFQQPRPAWKTLLRGFWPGFLAVGLAMAQLLPFLHLLFHSQRSSGYADSETGKIAAMPASGWVNYFVPLFRCAPNFNGVFMQRGQSWTASYYLGVGIVALALLAVWRVKDLRVRLLFALGLFGFVLAMGPAGFIEGAVVRLLPFLGFVRYFVKFAFLPTFALPLLAAFGLNRLITVSPEKWPAEWRFAKGFTLAVLCLIGGIVWFDQAHPGDVRLHDRVLANAGLRGLFLLTVVICAPFLRPGGKAKIQKAAVLALLLCGWLDVLTHAPDLSPTVSAAAWQPDATRQFFQWETQMRPVTSRAMRGKETFWKMLTDGSTDPNVDLEGRRLSLFMNLNLVDQIAKFDGFYSLDLQEHLDVFKHLYFTTNEAPGLLDFMGISEIGNPTNVVGWIHRATYRPLVTAGARPICLNPADTLNAVLADAFNPSQTVYLPVEAQGLAPTHGAPNAQILSPRFQARRLDFEVRSDAPAMVVVAQTFYSAWRAYVDGKAAPLWRANYAFQALATPAGQHQISLRYEDRPFHEGALISLLALVFCGGALWFTRRPKACSVK